MTEFKKIFAVISVMLFLTVAATLFVLAEPDETSSGEDTQTGTESVPAESDVNDGSSQTESGTETSSDTGSGDIDSSDESGSSEEGETSGGDESSDVIDSSDENSGSDTETSSEEETVSQNLNPSWNEYESERSTGGGGRTVIPPDPSYSGRVSGDWTTNDRSNAGQAGVDDNTPTSSAASVSKNLFDLKGKVKRWIILPITVALLSATALIAVNVNYAKSNGKGKSKGRERHDEHPTLRRPRD